MSEVKYRCMVCQKEWQERELFVEPMECRLTCGDPFCGAGVIKIDSVNKGRVKGHVKWWSRTRGFGFIIADSSEFDKDIFAHYSGIDGEGYRNLVEGEVVTFDVVPNGDKGVKAVNIRHIGTP